MRCEFKMTSIACLGYKFAIKMANIYSLKISAYENFTFFNPQNFSDL
jgi:hypothetical protein